LRYSNINIFIPFLHSSKNISTTTSNNLGTVIVHLKQMSLFGQPMSPFSPFPMQVALGLGPPFRRTRGGSRVTLVNEWAHPHKWKGKWCIRLVIHLLGNIEMCIHVLRDALLIRLDILLVEIFWDSPLSLPIGIFFVSEDSYKRLEDCFGLLYLKYLNHLFRFLNRLGIRSMRAYMRIWGTIWFCATWRSQLWAPHAKFPPLWFDRQAAPRIGKRTRSCPHFATNPLIVVAR